MKTYTEVITEHGYCLTEDPDGDWVKTSTAKALRDQRNEATDLLLKMCDGDSLQNRAAILSLKLKIQMWEEVRC